MTAELGVMRRVGSKRQLREIGEGGRIRRANGAGQDQTPDRDLTACSSEQENRRAGALIKSQLAEFKGIKGVRFAILGVEV